MHYTTIQSFQAKIMETLETLLTTKKNSQLQREQCIQPCTNLGIKNVEMRTDSKRTAWGEI